MSKKILIVEDEKNIVDILSFNLGREGYETLEAYDGAAGLKLALEEDPGNVILMHAIGANVSGQIASVIAGGLIIGLVSAYL